MGTFLQTEQKPATFIGSLRISLYYLFCNKPHPLFYTDELNHGICIIRFFHNWYYYFVLDLSLRPALLASVLFNIWANWVIRHLLWHRCQNLDTTRWFGFYFILLVRSFSVYPNIFFSHLLTLLFWVFYF